MSFFDTFLEKSCSGFKDQQNDFPSKWSSIILNISNQSSREEIKSAVTEFLVVEYRDSNLLGFVVTFRTSDFYYKYHTKLYNQVVSF